MAEMGAEVIKVEAFPNGDAARQLPFMKDGRSVYYVQQNGGKKSLRVNVKEPKGLAVCHWKRPALARTTARYWLIIWVLPKKY